MKVYFFFSLKDILIALVKCNNRNSNVVFPFFLHQVRYQNRKRLAEQRPRVRGQFVRQTDHNNSNDAAD